MKPDEKGDERESPCRGGSILGSHEETANRAIGQDLSQVKGLKELNIARMAMHVVQAGWSGGILFDIVTLPFPVILPLWP